MAKENSLFEDAMRRLDSAMKYTDFSEEIARRVGTPKSCLEVSIPLRRDDGSLEFFRGLSRPARRHPQPHQGRTALPSQRHARRSKVARLLDDV